MEFPDYYYSGFDWTAFACTACRIRLLAMQVEIQGDFVLSLHDCHAYAAAADFSAKLFSGELAGHSKFVLGNYSSGNVSAIGGISDSSADTGFSAGNVRSSQTGASEYRIYRSIVKPNLSSAIAAALILIFIDNWNIVDQAVIFLREPYQQPLSVYLCQILEEQPDIFYAASVFYAVPVLLIFLMGQDYLIQGISMSGVKA